MMKWDEWRGNLDGTVIVMRIKVLLRFMGCKFCVHKFVGEDSDDCFHTHPAVAIRIILWGWYVEELEDGTLKRWRAGMFGIVNPSLSHRVSSIANSGAWSLWLRFRNTTKVQLRGVGWEKQEGIEFDDRYGQ